MIEQFKNEWGDISDIGRIIYCVSLVIMMISGIYGIYLTIHNEFVKSILFIAIAFILSRAFRLWKRFPRKDLSK